jgi:hypothetical protein
MIIKRLYSLFHEIVKKNISNSYLNSFSVLAVLESISASIEYKEKQWYWCQYSLFLVIFHFSSSISLSSSLPSLIVHYHHQIFFTELNQLIEIN